MYKASYIIILLLLCIYCNNPQISEVPGCTNNIACNFDESANLDDGSCEYSEENYDCGNNCLVDVDCAGECGGDAVEDECGICGGNGIVDYDCNGNCITEIDCFGVCGGNAVNDCFEVCGGNAVDDICGICDGNVTNLSDCPCDSGIFDECGICNGPGSIYECGCTGLQEGRCDCDGRREDCAGQCGGSNIIDACGNCGDFIASNVCHDCLGVPNGDAVEDCAGVCGGSTMVDDCGECGGGTYLEYGDPVWQDEFEGDGLNLDKWNVEKWPAGAFNEEEQAYTDEIDNIYLADGKLHIRALRETYDPDENGIVDALYTSGRISTKYKGDWKYAKVEVKAQLPLGEGTWPAIWMLPTEDTYGGWPESGEIDIMEYVGNDPSRVHSSVHNATYYADLYQPGMPQPQTKSKTVGAVSTSHLYSMIWRGDRITFYVGDETAVSCPEDCDEIMVYDNLYTGFELWPFDQKFHLMLNLAIGGTWGGAVAPEIFPVEFIVDYVRVYQHQQSCE